MFNPEAYDKAQRYANLILIVLAIILLFWKPDFALGILAGALINKSMMQFSLKTKGQKLFWGLVGFLALILFLIYLMTGSLLFFGLIAALIIYALLRFLLYYILENAAS